MTDDRYFTFSTFNINGASTHEKKKDVFDYIRKKHFDIIFLQETHCKSETENLVRAIWGYNCFVCGNSTAKKGVAILFNNTFTYKIHNIIKDDVDGSYIIMDISIFEERFTLANIYGPSDKDSPDFFTKVFDIIDNIGNRQVVTAGDFNVILNPSIDARNYKSYCSRPKSRRCINEIMERMDLVDIYRKVYPIKRQYTWRKFNTIQQSRLDYFLISDSLVTSVKNIDIIPGYRSDHSIVCLSIINNMTNFRPKTYWKFNNSLLYDKDYVMMIKETILSIIKQYCLPVYNFENICNIDSKDIQFSINDQLFFEALLLEIRGRTISFSSQKKKKEQKEENILNENIRKLENKENLNQNEMVELEDKKCLLQEIREKKIRGMMIRSRLQWLQDGEKPSKYFCGLENRNFVSKRMSFIETDNHDILFEQEDLIRETKSFYQSLYSKKETDNVDLETIIQEPIKLDNQEKESLEGLITYQEAIAVLKNMKNNKSPGNSGFTNEFYKFFFLDIGNFLVRSINYGFLNKKLSITQRQGVITCLPKEGKNIQKLNNWRPISLLNVQYKIASACIAERLKNVLCKIINKCQNGFISSRCISDNLRLMYDTLLYTEHENIPGMLMLIDFQKAFDCLSWDFIDNVLNFLKFGNDFKNWIKVFYTEITSCVQVNGSYSEYFQIQRGVRQGDPLSPYLFLICAQILTYLIFENDKIKGLKIDDEEVCLSQFADDTALYLDGTKDSFEESIRVLMYFANISGLNMNYDKTVIVWLGSRKNCELRYMRDRNFTWDPGGETDSKFKYLGILFSTNTENIVKLNYEKKYSDIEKILKTWDKRFLTPFGKITIIKTLALSKLTYLFMNLPDPPDDFLKQIDQLFYRFLWNSNHHRISKKQSCLDYIEGGLNMVNVFDFIAQMKLKAVRKLFENSDGTSVTFKMYPNMKKIQKMGDEYVNVLINNIKNPFWHDVLIHVKKFLAISKPTDFHELICERIFYNSNIKIDGHTICYKNFIENDVTQFYNVMKDHNGGNVCFLTYMEFVQIYPNLHFNFLQYHGIIQSIKRYMIKMNIVFENDINVQEPVGWQLILKGSKQAIKEKLRGETLKHTSLLKWERTFQNLCWKNIYFKCFKSTSDSKLKWFQFRLLFRILPTNRYLKIMKIKDSNLCQFCNQSEETIEHLFWECNVIDQFWMYIKNQFINNLPHAHSLTLTKDLILFGTKTNVYTDRPFDIMIMNAKFFIWSSRFSNSIPMGDIFLKQFKIKLKIEKMYSHNLNRKDVEKEYAPYLNFLFN